MPLAAGTRLGAYEIRAPLGRGGVGEVYRAWDPRLEREVAIKILHECSETDPDRLRRFVAEARAASALNHPNIITVFDAAVDDATPYIVSELIEGDSVRGELRRGPVPLKRLLDLATQIADGLAEAHAAGIVHRDLKPENIMVTPGGRAKILDFGLARTTGLQTGGGVLTDSEGQTQTVSGLLIGTVPYMSPEQARGSATDFRSDQFSFGLILYELANGAAAFRRATPAETLESILNEEPRPLPEVNAQTPLLLWWIVERCLAKNPTDRYASTADLHRDLRNLRDRLGDAIARERRPHAESTRRSLARHFLSAAAAIGAFAAGAMLWASWAAPPPIDASTLRFTPFATEARYEGLPAWSPDGQTIAYSAEVNGILQIFTRSLTSAAPAQVTEAAFDCRHPFWSSDGKRLYYVSMAKTQDAIWSVGAAGGTPQVVVHNASRGAISPDGRTLAFLRDEERADIFGTAVLYLATPGGTDAWSSDRVEAAAKPYAEFGSLRFVEGALAYSPDGRTLGLTGVPFNKGLPVKDSVEPQFGWQFWLVPASAVGAPSRRLAWWSEPFPRITGFTWLPDSRHIVFSVTVAATPGSHLWMADVERDRVWPLTRSADSESYPAASPGGERVVLTTGEPDYDLVELSTSGSAMKTLLATARKETDPVWSRDGNLVVYVTDRNGSDEIWVRNRTGEPSDRPLITQRDFVDGQNVLLAAPSFAPDGQSIAYLRSGRPRQSAIVALQIFTSRTAGGPPVPLLPGLRSSYQSAPTWSPDGQWIAFAEWRERHWDLVKMRVGSGEDPVVVRTDGAPNATPQWSPQGDWITWETEAGFLLVSPDGTSERAIETDQWLVHAWSRDGSAILGITETEDLRLSLVSVDIRTAHPRALADLGPSPPVNNPVQGFSVSPDGKTILTSVIRMRGDLWLLEGLRRPQSIWRRFF